MSDLISRQDVIDAIEEEWNECLSEYDAQTIINDTVRRIEQLPSVQKKGEWMPHPTNREYDVCSSCGIGVQRREYGLNPDGKEWVSEVSYMFCPWCGARMEVKS